MFLNHALLYGLCRLRINDAKFACSRQLVLFVHSDHADRQSMNLADRSRTCLHRGMHRFRSFIIGESIKFAGRYALVEMMSISRT
jgi:hypothetical protein